MTNPVSLLQDVRGFARDFAIDAMPRGYVWDLVDYIPNRRGAKLEARGPWSFFSAAVGAGKIWGGKHAAYRAGTKLLVGQNIDLYEVEADGTTTYIATDVGPCVHNPVFLRDRVWFTPGGVPPYALTWNGTAYAWANAPAGTPAGTLACVYKDRLVISGVPAGSTFGTTPTDPAHLYFSPLETAGTPPNTGPLAAWDPLSFIGTQRAVTAMFPMTGQILAFHDGSISKVRGGKPPAAGVDTDMAIDSFSEEIGCSDPSTVVAWQENVCFANAHGVYLSDGATIRSLTEQGGIGDLWRELYAARARSGSPGNQAQAELHAAVFLDKLHVTINTTPEGLSEPLGTFTSMTLVCDLPTRTWSRWGNVKASAYIESEIGTEEVWWGHDTDGDPIGSGTEYRLCKMSPIYFGPTEYDPAVGPNGAVDAVDGNTVPVLPSIRTGWQRVSQEGVKRLRHVYVSHITQDADGGTTPDVLEVGARISPFPHLVPMSMGKIGSNPRYTRNRLRVDRRGYGIQVEVKQVVPTYLSRLFDISVDLWPQDRGKL